eukprot:gene23940-8734_t
MKIVVVVMMAFGAVAGGVPGNSSNAGPSRPHIVFLLPDDLGYNNVPWNTNSVTIGKLPHLERLAKDALFLPATLMTGRYPYRSGWNTYGGGGCLKMCKAGCCPGYMGYAEELSSLPSSFELMPAMMKRAGYSTHMLGKWHLGHFSQAHTPVGRGFDTFFGFLLGSETHDTHNSWGRHT